MTLAWVAVLILAVVQGATEFLPVSSSGHLRLGHALLGTGEPDLLLDVVLHVGTLVAVLVIYRRDVLVALRGAFAGLRRLPRVGLGGAMREEGFAFAAYIVVGSVITAVVGLTLKDAVEGALGAPRWVGSMLLVNGCVLWSVRWVRREESTAEPGLDTGLTWGRAALIGLLQGIAVVPGISRSGLTITGAMWLGVSGPQAARFSFLMSVPAILGALALHLGELGGATRGAAQQPSLLVLGFVVAALVGAASLRGLMRLLRRAQFHHFAWYCWLLGGSAVAWSLLG